MDASLREDIFPYAKGWGRDRQDYGGTDGLARGGLQPELEGGVPAVAIPYDF